MKTGKYIFGPVPSRRLGRSLGVDLVPHKTCSLDCIYCQVGVTTCKTIERKEYVPTDAVLEQIRAALEQGASPDYITLAGSGEPTLHSRIEEIIAGIHGFTSIPVDVLTNGALLWMPEVRREILDADLVIPSLDAGSPEVFQRVNRPHPALEFEKTVEGLIRFREEYSGPIWLEVFIVGGISDTEEEFGKIAGLVKKIRPDKVQINTTIRPTAEKYALSSPEEKLGRLAELIGDRAEIIADFRKIHKEPEFTARRSDVLELLARRPCTLQDIAAGLGIHENEAAKHVGELLSMNRIVADRVGQKVFYKIDSGNR